MSDYYETDGSCRRCLRSSPACSLIALILVFLGTVGFGTGAILFRRYFMVETMGVKDYAWIDFIIYGIIGAIALFTILAYLLCSLSTGYNSKRCFDTSRKSCCGRCCNMFLILCLCFGILLWIIVLAGSSLIIGNYMQLMSDQYTRLEDFDFAKLFQSQEADASSGGAGSGPSISLKPYGFSSHEADKSILDSVKEKSLICLGAVFVGELMILFGYLIIVICVAMNFARLQERRYYEVDDGEETIALR